MKNLFNETKKKHLEARLDMLLQQYNAISIQLNNELNPEGIIKLRMKLESIEREAQEVQRLLTESNGLNQLAKGDKEIPMQAVMGAGNRWAVLVGVNQYEDKSNYGKLSVCVNDVNAIAEHLKTSSYDKKRVRLLTDNTKALPKRNNILTTLQSVANATDSSDLLLFYYSGHGDLFNGESFLVPRDGFYQSLADTGVLVSRVVHIIKNAAASAKIIILDACHSGANIGGKGPKIMSVEFIQRVFEQAEGLAILASCKQGQLSYEWRVRERSIFTHHLLEAISGKADEDQKGFVTVQDAYRYVVNGVKLWASQNNLTQTPTLEYQVAGDIILADLRK